jgi:hypothetical protein
MRADNLALEGAERSERNNEQDQHKPIYHNHDWEIIW